MHVFKQDEITEASEKEILKFAQAHFEADIGKLRMKQMEQDGFLNDTDSWMLEWMNDFVVLVEQKYAMLDTVSKEQSDRIYTILINVLPRLMK